jgi:hypothetical protein
LIAGRRARQADRVEQPSAFVEGGRGVQVGVGVDGEGDEPVGVWHAEIGHRSSPSHCEATVTRTRRDGGQHCDEAFKPGCYQVTAAQPMGVE